MSQVAIQPVGLTGAAAREQQVRTRIEALSYLPTTAAVAMKFVELGKNPDAEPSEYARIISADNSLTSKLLALANSSWFGVRNRVTSVKMAVNLLGLGTVRTLAISYCMAGLHNDLRLKPDESRMFWEGALCKAVAAKQYARMIDDSFAEDAFVAGMFQDFALPIMFVTARDELLAVLHDPAIDGPAAVQKERELFRLDHAEVGRILAQKLELPELFVDAVAFHHNRARLCEILEQKVIAEAVYVASLFPPILEHWAHSDAEELCRFLDERRPGQAGETTGFLERVQKEFNQIRRFFEEGEAPETRLAELMVHAAMEAADNTTHLVRTVNDLMQDTARMGVKLNQLLECQNQLQDRALRDPLTGVLNREGFASRADDILVMAGRYGVGCAALFLDMDKFKSINDTLGHEFGDQALRRAASEMTAAVRRHDLIGRLGGDEFAIVLYDCDEAGARDVAGRILERVSASPVTKGQQEMRSTLSAGLVCWPASNEPASLADLLTCADELMYQAKQAGGNQIMVRTGCP